MSEPRVMIMHAPGTNRDREAALACELAGGVPEIVHINQLFGGERKLVGLPDAGASPAASRTAMTWAPGDCGPTTSITG